MTRRRTQNQLRRILLLIDAMAGFRLPKTTQEILDHLQEHTGLEYGYMGLVSFNGCRDSNSCKGPHTYKLNLKLTENLQAAAMKLTNHEETKHGN